MFLKARLWRKLTNSDGENYPEVELVHQSFIKFIQLIRSKTIDVIVTKEYVDDF